MRWPESFVAFLSCSLAILILLLLSGCKRYKPPQAELCGYHADSGTAVCNDPRRNPEDYSRQLLNGDLITSPESYERARAYCAEMRTKLIKCENRLRNCR